MNPGPQEEKSALQSISEKLYSRRASRSVVREHALRPEEDKAPDEWNESESPVEEPKRPIPYLRFIVGFSFFLLITVSSYGFYLIFSSSNRVSSGNVDISVSGPVSIRGGEPLTLAVSVGNRNAVPLELADLIIEYPEGTRDPSNPALELPRYREGLGTIPSGGEVVRPVSAVLFGEERSNQKINITVEYRLPDSNAIFYKESSYEVVLSSSPLSLIIAAPGEHNSGQEISFVVSLTSNSETVTKDVLLRAEYPSGFSFRSAEPSAYFDTTVWRLGDIRPESKRTVTIRGVLSGDEGDHRVFRFEAGLAASDDEKNISIPFATALKEIAVNRPFVTLSMTLDGSKDPEISIPSGRNVRIDIPYVNNLMEPVSDIEISLELTGSGLERSSVLPDKGFFRSLDNTVIWNAGTYPPLANVPPGGAGVVSLSLSSVALPSVASLRNPEINLLASVRGRHQLSGKVPEEVVGQVSRRLKVSSDLQFSPRILHWSGPLTNTGPIPPKVESDTSYTVTWAVGSGSNDISDAKVTATLPTYVRFLGSVTPQSESVTFNQIGGTVTWDIGLIKAGTGFGTTPREVSFQVVFTPSLSQVGSSPTIVNEATFSATDRFTGSRLLAKRPPLTTLLTTDTGIKFGDETVVK